MEKNRKEAVRHNLRSFTYDFFAPVPNRDDKKIKQKAQMNFPIVKECV